MGTCSGTSGAVASTGKGTGSSPQLDKELVRRANEAATLDIGDSTAKKYERNISTILNDYTFLSDTEKKQAISTLHALTEQQLKAESQRVNAYATGRGVARFDRQESQKTGDAAINARLKVDEYMKEVHELNLKNHREANQRAMTNAMSKALSSGALEFTVNGATYRRKSKRAKSFERVYD